MSVELLGGTGMRVSELYAPTLREVPGEAEIPSHRLMLRGGFMRKLVSGVYSYLPLGYRVIRKVEQIVREEMDAEGGLEILMSALQPAELWKESGRWDSIGEEMFRLQDRSERQFCLGPTHEEIFTDLIRDEVRSYRQLPLLLYQIQTKYRDEVRPRFGLVRAREFIMKDLYSFDRDEDGLSESYMKMQRAYGRVFDRCGLTYRVVEADVGAMGGTDSHEFVVLSEIGEAELVYCESCGYAANVERAECKRGEAISVETEAEKPRRVETPGKRTIEEVSEFLGRSPKGLVKTLLYSVNGRPVAVLIRGDRAVNESKLKRALGVPELTLADEETILRVTGAPVGFTGPVGLEVDRVIADYEIESMSLFVTGANEEDAHLVDVTPGRDFTVTDYCDIRHAEAGDACTRCDGRLKGARGTEVGHVFKLGTKYSGTLNARYTDEKGESHNMVMGSYGLGVTRTVAAIIDTSCDENGIIWPMTVAPYHCVVIPVNTTDASQMEVATELYEQLKAAGVEAVLDDRDERPGVKFKDADLIGYPLRLTVGSRGLKEGRVELKERSDSVLRMVPVSEICDEVARLVSSEIAKLNEVPSSEE